MHWALASCLRTPESHPALYLICHALPLGWIPEHLLAVPCFLAAWETSWRAASLTTSCLVSSDLAFVHGH